ncbi:mannose-specific lectin 3-like [Dendrobium catenatum]|uniref:Mannose-specific lectin 1 n=1 Tax=Dendrobium catenatum TaxID=906689 RepID=A0A2I0WN64_9ASPA|nr:mannose-specific lectin 3-like [Dendrobium catenatum]PKU77104.1 Mannose-specific lectin 1 [Dendrobium catenatum]
MALIPSTLLLSTLLLLLHFPSHSTANEGNLIVTGDVLQTDSQLTFRNAVFVIQDDCNLVLYNKGSGFQSGTSGLGPNCIATISEYGELQIKNNTGSIVWSTPASKQRGEYAAILQPDGQVGIYGPSLWNTRQIGRYSVNNTVGEKDINKGSSTPNLLFSSEVLNEKSKLASRDYTLEVTEKCVLEFTKASVGVLWASPTKLRDYQHCFIRLNHHGQLALVNDYNRIVWETKPAYDDGVYVLVVKINGEAVIYGKRIWST